MGKILHREHADGVAHMLEALMDVWAMKLPFDITITPTGGVRTNEQQAKLFALGRTVPGPHAGEPGHLLLGDCVTKARTVDDTAHGHAAAIDAMPLLDDGHIAWDRHDPRWADTFSRLCQMAHWANDMGFIWGGDWSGFRDWDHFEMKQWREMPVIQGGDKAGSSPAPSYADATQTKES